MNSETSDWLIVGAGFSGSVCARRLADAGHRVLIIDRREHIGGNAYDVRDAAGVLIHPYGPHIFHTNSERVMRYLSRFTDWRFYEHRVLAQVDGQLLPIPINRRTLSMLYAREFTEGEAQAYLESVRVPGQSPARSSEDVVLRSVGAELCEKFFRGYTKKQWGLDLSELSPGVAARIPTRTNDDDRYFTDRFQFMPSAGYTTMFERMLDHPMIEVRLREDFEAWRAAPTRRGTVYTGPIDAYFDQRFGKLPYRSLRFAHEHLPNTQRFQPTGTVNFPNDHEFTRTTEFKHLTGQECAGTSIVREYPQAAGEPFYPIPRTENEALYKQYEALAHAQQRVWFVGRLAQYRYYNMDQAIAAALKQSDELLSNVG